MASLYNINGSNHKATPCWTKPIAFRVSPRLILCLSHTQNLCFNYKNGRLLTSLCGIFLGHSLGGAVATLVALDLLHGAEKEGRKADVTCYSFATPAIGNNRLAELAESRGWASHIHTFLLPGSRPLVSAS